MKSTEVFDERLKRVDMHDFFLEKINRAIKDKRYIEASWLIYSCMENRYFRTVEKIKKQCKYSSGKCHKSKNELALKTKVNCIQRLSRAGCECFKIAFPDELFEKTKAWIKNRNNLMHNLLQLEQYENMDNEFMKVSMDGIKILKDTYEACTKFRKIFYSEDYKFIFPEESMEGCSCKPRDGKAD
ncbi:MAG: hypothetical protein IJH12_08765 [Clostridia bacterium]|nr:hypothetical protein [Clostridia bacterium]